METYRLTRYERTEEQIEAATPEEAADLFKARHGCDPFEVDGRMVRGRCQACNKLAYYGEGDKLVFDDKGKLTFHLRCINAVPAAPVSPLDKIEPATTCETPVMTRE